MTKRDMVAAIQLAEAKAWLSLKETELSFGKTDSYTNTKRNRWCEVNSLMESLGIKSDNKLPEQVEAFEILHKILAQEREALTDIVELERA